jgi:hypothetical protein
MLVHEKMKYSARQGGLAKWMEKESEEEARYVPNLKAIFSQKSCLSSTRFSQNLLSQIAKIPFPPT